MTCKDALIVGVHTSIAGGLPGAVRSAAEKGCDAFQIFARNPRGWLARELASDEVRQFRDAQPHVALELTFSLPSFRDYEAFTASMAEMS